MTSATGAGAISSKGYGVGASATWYGNHNRYLDLQGQVSKINSDITSSTAGALISDHATTAYALSVEVGQSIRMKDGKSSLIPQAQLTFSGASASSLTDSTSSTVAFSASKSLTARLGLAYEVALSDSTAAKAASKAYVFGDLIRKFSDGDVVDVAGDVLTIETQGSWLEIGAGGTFHLDDTKAIFAEASYKKGLGGNARRNTSIGLSAGLKIRW